MEVQAQKQQDDKKVYLSLTSKLRSHVGLLPHGIEVETGKFV